MVIDDSLQAIMAQHHIPGLSVAVVQEGETVLMKGYGLANIEHTVSATEHTVYEIASIGKIFSAIATLLLVEEDLISLNDSIIDYLDDPPEAWQPVTLRHILTHQSGIPSYTDAPNYWELTRLELSKAEVLGLVSDLPLKFSPGQESAYDNTGYYLLGLMLETVTGKTYGEVLRDRIFAPLGMNATQMNHPAHIVPHRASGYQWRNNQLYNKPYYSPSVTYSAGGQLSSVADMVKWEKALHNQTLLQPATLEQMWTPYPSARGNEWEDRKYVLGLGWFILNYGDRRVVSHNGSILGFASNITRFIDDRISVIVLCNLDRIARPDAIAKTVAGYYCPSLAELPLQPPEQT